MVWRKEAEKQQQRPRWRSATWWEGRSPREHTQALASIQKKRTEDKKKDSVGGGVEGGGSGVQTHQNLMKARVDSSRGRNSGKNVYAVLR